MRDRPERVVVTGLGAVTPLGPDVPSFWTGLVEGRGAYRPVTAFDTAGQRTLVGCEAACFDGEDLVARGLHPAGRATRMAAAAAEEALRQAGLDREALRGSRSGVCLGTTMGEIRVLESHLEAEAAGVAADGPPLADYPCFRIPRGVAAFLGLRGPVMMVPTACAAGNYAIGLGRDLILRGEAEVVLAGGVDPYSRVAHTGFNRLLSMSPDVCRPFDLRRKGIVPGEGAGVLVLERESRARARGALPLAVVLGYGLSNDAFHIVNPDPDGLGLLRAMEAALEDAGLAADDIGYVSAHGTGTPANDAAESRAVRAFLGERYRSVPVSSIKSMIGHTMGAASALEAVACVMALLTGTIPPTANYQVPDPVCDLDVVPNVARRHRADVILSNAMAFGGNNACLLLGRS